MSTFPILLWALSAGSALALPATKRQDTSALTSELESLNLTLAELPIAPFTCLATGQLAGACCKTNENPDYTNFYCSTPTGTALLDVAGAYVCPTSDSNDSRAVEPMCCSVLDHGTKDDGYTLWCEQPHEAELLDTSSLSTTELEAIISELETALTEPDTSELSDLLDLDDSELDDLVAELEEASKSLDASAVEDAVATVTSELKAPELAAPTA